MIDYLLDTEYISKKLIELVVETEKKNDIMQKSKEGRKEVNDKYQEFALAKSLDERTEKRDETISSLISFDEKHEKDGIRYMDVVEIAKYTDSEMAVYHALGVISSALLQIGKQGISIVHGADKYDCFSQGRKTFGSATLLDVIWEGRNQSIHYEDRDFSEGVDLCFAALIDRDSVFKNYKKGVNLAYHLIKLLEWDKYEEYRVDMLSLD